jgi:protein translocase SecG subunit
MAVVLGVFQVIISIVLIFLILLHSGKDAGLSCFVDATVGGDLPAQTSSSTYDAFVSGAFLLNVAAARPA